MDSAGWNSVSLPDIMLMEFTGCALVHQFVNVLAYADVIVVTALHGMLSNHYLIF